jgi:hypothetical protein
LSQTYLFEIVYHPNQRSNRNKKSKRLLETEGEKGKSEGLEVKVLTTGWISVRNSALEMLHCGR